MEKLGESLSHNFFTFKYPGRESKYINEFIVHKPDILNKYIYEINITTGSLLYSCKGGMGITKEPYIIPMHKYISKKNFPRTLKETFSENFGKQFGKWKYHALRDRFSWLEHKVPTMRRGAELYCLWAGSNFSHRYRVRGYDGVFFPTQIDYQGIKNAGAISREKGLIFRENNEFSMAENIITPDVVLYTHIPYHFSKYGCEFYWNKKSLSKVIRIINEFDELGHKVLVSMPYKKRGVIDEFDKLTKIFEKYNYFVFPKIKVKKYDIELDNSEIYFYNF